MRNKMGPVLRQQVMGNRERHEPGYCPACMRAGSGETPYWRNLDAANCCLWVTFDYTARERIAQHVSAGAHWVEAIEAEERRA